MNVAVFEPCGTVTDSGTSSRLVFEERGTTTPPLGAGVVEHNGLFAYQKVGNKTKQVEASFVVSGNSASFRLGSYDRSKPLVIDPLVWSTLIGRSTGAIFYDVALDSFGNPVAVGFGGFDFPTISGAYDQTHNGGGDDAVVSKMSSNGSSLLWSTFLGGGYQETAYCVALDSTGSVYIAGQTNSINFPTTAGAFDTSYNGGLDWEETDVFVSKLSADGASLVYSTYIGGFNTGSPLYHFGNDVAYSISVDASGNAVLAGSTDSINFPTTAGAFDETNNNGVDAFVAKLASSGSTLIWSTLLGGFGGEVAYSVALDDYGHAGSHVVVAGLTSSSDFPTTEGAFDVSHNGDHDAFVAKLYSSGSALLWSTFLGGSGTDRSYAVALDPSANVVLAGLTSSSDFPTTGGALDQTHNGSEDAFISKLSSDGSNLSASTFLGGTGEDYATSLAINPSGGVGVVGLTWSTNFPTTPGAQRQTAERSEAFVEVLSADMSALVYGTFHGGSDQELANAIDFDASGQPVVAGWTTSTDFPTTVGAYDEGGYVFNVRGFLARFLIAPPTAANNSYGVNTGSSLNISAPGVLGNDVYAINAVLTQAPAQAAAFTLNSDGSFSYTPNAGFTGVDTFKYKAQNGAGLSNEATVTLNVRAVLSSITINQSPIPGGVSITGTVTLTTPAKPGGQAVYFSDGQTWFLAEGYTVTVPGGSSSAPFTINTTPPPYSVTGKVYCTLANGSGISKNASVTIKPLPKAVNDSYKLNANGTLNISAPGVLSNDINLLGGTAVLVSGPSNASSFALNANGSFSYTPNTGFIGDDIFTYRCQNAGGTGTIIATVSITARAVLASMTNLNNPVTGGNNLTGTVTLVGNAPVGGVTVYFTDTLAALNTTGYTVVVPFGSSSANFSIPTTAVGTPQSGSLTATLSNGSGINKTKTVNINP